MGLFSESGGDIDGAGNIAYRDSDVDSSQAPAPSGSLVPAPLSDIGMSDVGLSNADSSNVGLSGVDIDSLLQPDIPSAMDAEITLPLCGSNAKRVGGTSPTRQQAMVTLDEAIVWPVTSLVKAEEATVLSAEEVMCRDDRDIGHDGEVTSSGKQDGACLLANI